MSSCGVMEEAGSRCGWVPAPLMTVRASKKGISRDLSKRTVLGMRRRESKVVMAALEWAFVLVNGVLGYVEPCGVG